MSNRRLGDGMRDSRVLSCLHVGDIIRYTTYGLASCPARLFLHHHLFETRGDATDSLGARPASGPRVQRQELL